MLRVTLIVGADPENRQAKAEQLFSRLFPDEQGRQPKTDFNVYQDPLSLKISHVRRLQKDLSLKPYQHPIQIFYLKEAQNLTLPAQHALLKTLEEPPPTAHIILTADRKESLLPTIISRCQLITLRSAPLPADRSDLELLQTIIKSSPGERLAIAEKYGRKDTAINFCRQQLLAWHRLILDNPRDYPTDPIRCLYLAVSQLEVNVNPLLVIGNLLLSYPG